MLLNSINMTGAEGVVELLKMVKTDTMWGFAIAQVVANPDHYRIADLVGELQSQAHDNPDMMQRILGDEVYTKIMAIELH